jgi:hypothetical protein
MECKNREHGMEENENKECKEEGAMNVCPCHHGMAHPQVADGGTASNMEGNCE